MDTIKFLRRAVLTLLALCAWVASTVASAQSLIVAPAAVNFGNQLVGTVSPPFVLSLRNDLGQVAPATVQSYAGLTNAISVTQTGGSCPATLPFVLAVGATCTISLTFAPTVPVIVSSTFDVVTSAGTITLSVTGRGIVNVPLPTVAPSQLNFGLGPPHNSLIATFTNTGTLPLDLLGWTGAPSTSRGACGSDFCVIGGTCTRRYGVLFIVYGIESPLAAGASCTMAVAPSAAQLGVTSGMLVLQTGAGDVSVALSSSKGALTSNTISASPSPLSFGNQSVGSTAQQLLTLTNPGPLTSNLFGVDLYFTNPSPISVSGGNCPGVFPFALTAGSSCTVQLSFSPAVAGVQGTEVLVRSDTGNFSVNVLGIAVMPTPLAVRPASATFSASATAFEARTFTLTNPAAVATTISALSLPSGYFSLGTVGTCGALPIILPPAASCTVDVNRVPGAVAGVAQVTSSNGNLSVPLNVASPAVVNLNLATTPPGLRLKVDGQLFPTPLSLQVASGTSVSVEAVAQNLAASGYTFASWSDAGAAAHVVVVPAAGGTFTATFSPTPFVPKLDVDNDGVVSAATDGMLVLRYLLGIRGTALVAGLPIPATAERSAPASIVAYLDQILASLDIDGVGGAHATTDGLLIYRYLAGKTGITLFGSTAVPGTRTQTQMLSTLDAMLP